MPLNLETCNWEHSLSIIEPSFHKSTLQLPHAQIIVSYDTDTNPIAYKINIGLSPASGTTNAWPSTMIEETYQARTLKDAQLRSLELLSQYISSIQAEIKEHLTATITRH